MKYLIISDTHGYKNYLEQVLNKSHDIHNIIYLGDGINDILTAKVSRPNLNLISAVAGNCDVNKALPTQEILNLNGKKVLVCHGDGYHVKLGLLPLRKRSMALGVDIALYGHTHRQYYEYYSGLYMFNPGSVMPSGNPFSCYGIMEISPEGIVNFSFEEV